MTETAITERPDQQLARPLRVLVPLIKEDLRQAQEASERAGEPYYRSAGEKMMEAKPQMKHGEFTPWLKRNFNISAQHARRYMLYARATMDEQKERTRSFSQVMREESGDAGYGKVVRKRDWHEGVRESIERAKQEAQRLREAELTRQQERKAEQDLALRLIEIGFKVLAKELHPDKGGSREAMARLNRVRDRLKNSA